MVGLCNEFISVKSNKITTILQCYGGAVHVLDGTLKEKQRECSSSQLPISFRRFVLCEKQPVLARSPSSGPVDQIVVSRPTRVCEMPRWTV